jgi:CRISPR system Cascade subunit CasB
VTRSERDRRFVDYLQGLVRSEGQSRPDLVTGLRRCSERPAGVPWRALRWLAPWTSRVSLAEQRLLLLVSGLFALHPFHTPGGNLGSVMAAVSLSRGQPAGGSKLPHLERRFIALLEADAEDLVHHLRRAVSLARAAEVPLDWARLLQDLRQWEDPSQWVQGEWARSFWGLAGRTKRAAAGNARSPSRGCECAVARATPLGQAGI